MENKNIVKHAEIDKDVLETISKESVDKIINDDKLFNRAMLNAYAELLSEFKVLRQSHIDLVEMLSILASEKLDEFFVDVKEASEKADQDKETE